jgi:hypothetical protein
LPAMTINTWHVSSGSSVKFMHRSNTTASR